MFVTLFIFVTPIALTAFKIYCKSVCHSFYFRHTHCTSNILNLIQECLSLFLLSSHPLHSLHFISIARVFVIFFIFVTPIALPTFKIYCKSVCHSFYFRHTHCTSNILNQIQECLSLFLFSSHPLHFLHLKSIARVFVTLFIFVTPIALSTFKIHCKSVCHSFYFCASTMYPVSAWSTWYYICHYFSTTNATCVLLARWLYAYPFNLSHHNLCFHKIHFQAFSLKCTFLCNKFFLQLRHGLRYEN